MTKQEQSKMRTKKEILDRIKTHQEYKNKVLEVMETNPNQVTSAAIGYHAIINQIDELQWVLGKEDEPDTKDLKL